MTHPTSSDTSVQPLTEATFDETIADASAPVLIDFWAAWCGPCGPMAEVLEAFAAAHAEHLVVGSVDIDAEPALARRFEVMSAPTLLLFAQGRLERRLVGARGPGRLLEDLSPYLDRS